MEMACIILLSLVFWGSLALLFHTYAGFPFLLSLLAKGKSLPEVSADKDDELPEVAVLMAVYNEEAVLEKSIESILASEYPREKLRVYIGSDGSTDRSDSIVEQFRSHHPELSLTVFGGRNGKIKIINQLSETAMHEFRKPDEALLFLCDANVSWSPELIKKAVRHFRREEVGFVGTSVVDSSKQQSGIAAEEDAYVGLENLTKFREGVLWGKVMGAFGACYAMRASLFQKVPENYIVDDFFLTMGCLEKGYDGIVDLEAVCYESVSSEITEEFRRKRRIATGNFQNLNHFRKFLQPWNGGFPVWFAFWSHKGLRWIGPLLLFSAMISCVVLAAFESFYFLPLVGFVGTFLVSLFDHWQSRKENGVSIRLFRFIRYFYSMNLALLMGLVAYCKGVGNSIWEPTKREVANEPAVTES